MLFSLTDSFSAIRNLRLKTLLSPVPARTDFQSHPVVHASLTDICIHYTSCMPEVPVSTCVRLSPVPMCLTVHFLYRLTDFVQKAKPLTFDIQGCIDISIMLYATVWTRPFSNIQVFHGFVCTTTDATGLRRREPSVNLLQIFTTFCHFIVQHRGKHAPSVIESGFAVAKAFICNCLHIQIFNQNSVVLICQSCALFVKVVQSLIGNMFMQVSHFLKLFQIAMGFCFSLLEPTLFLSFRCSFFSLAWLSRNHFGIPAILPLLSTYSPSDL